MAEDRDYLSNGKETRLPNFFSLDVTVFHFALRNV